MSAWALGLALSVFAFALFVPKNEFASNLTLIQGGKDSEV